MASTDKARGGGVADAAGQLYRWTLGIGHERNIGGVERTVRYTLGIVFVLAALAVLVVPVLSGLTNLALAVVLFLCGAFAIYEARVQYCPLNDSLGRSTYRE
ncbi:YgaP-like transmembrane domain [Haloarchaeobius sp. DYHT-AS-18]|uniref:YgaP-like transmembrane domain n=1 Tax=Haloarchaeobius sp. DYHT-AS-18 TaxID=3446117 RepID=UPI003EBCEF01